MAAPAKTDAELLAALAPESTRTANHQPPAAAAAAAAVTPAPAADPSARASLAVVSSSSATDTDDEEYDQEVDRWSIDPSECILGKKIGKGAFGVVYRGNLRGKEVAIKKLTSVNFDDETLDAFRKEVVILSKMRHPNVLLFMGACMQPGNLIIVTEWMERGSVYDLMHQDPPEFFPFKVKMKWVKEASMGMNWLHKSRNVCIHRDLKCGNLLVDANNTVKIADFGLSIVKKKAGKSSFGAIGTPLWMAPEVLRNESYDESADLYSFGIVLWEILTGEDPFPQIETFSTMMDVVCIKHERPPIPDYCPPALAKAIAECWDPEPSRRCTFEQLLKDRVFDESVLQDTVQDQHGRELWRKSFMTKDGLRETVSWRDFVVALTTFYKKPLPKDSEDIRFRCLHAVVCKEDSDDVELETFARVLAWFGPMTGLDILERIYDLLKRPWFHGNISSSQAEKLLQGPKQKKGTFLARFSAAERGAYAISALGKDGKVKHYRVMHKPGGPFEIGKIQCVSLEEVVTKWRKELYLKHAAAGWPYAELFEKKKVAKETTMGYQVPDF